MIHDHYHLRHSGDFGQPSLSGTLCGILTSEKLGSNTFDTSCMKTNDKDVSSMRSGLSLERSKSACYRRYSLLTVVVDKCLNTVVRVSALTMRAKIWCW